MTDRAREVRTRLSSLRLSPTRGTEIVDELEQAVWSLNPNLSLTNAQTLEQIRRTSWPHTSSVLVCDVRGMPSAMGPKRGSSW
jgi:hypothetical protein